MSSRQLSGFAVAVLAACSCASVQAQGQGPVNRTPVFMQGVIATGANRFCGEELFTFEEQGLTPLSFRQVGAFAPGAERPDELTSVNCTPDQLLATIHDPVLSFDPPGPAPAIVQEPDVRLQNLPLRDVPRTVGVVGGGADGSRATLGAAPTIPANPFPVYLSESNQPITLRKWTSAEGWARYRCRRDGTARFSARFRDLIENGVYSMWGIWRTELPNGLTVDLPSPLGGIPNAVVASSRGSASFQRQLPFCPGEETADGSLLLWVALAYHSDSALYGGVPDQADLITPFIDDAGFTFESPLSLMMHHEQVVFPINFTSRNPNVPALSDY